MTFGTARGYAQVVYEEEPVLVQPPVEDSEDKLLEVFRAISGTESEASWKPASSC